MNEHCLSPNIIGISARAGGGKDTVAKMIQSLILGSDFSLEEITFNYRIGLLLEKESEWKIKKFAGKLKEVASIMLGVDVGMFESQSFKKEYLKEWGMTVREFFKKLGTDAIRNNLHENAWVKTFWVDYNNDNLDKCLITDVRFPNEADSIKDRNGIVIRLTRNSENEDVHPSETSLDNYDFDYVIDNKDANLAETNKMVKDFLSHFNIWNEC
jgi:hypothetical protein